MALIALKCPQCNAELTVDNDRAFLYCEYCGTKVMVRDDRAVTNNYSTNTVTNVTYADGHAVHTADWYYETWQGLLARKRYDEADDLFEEFKHEYPLDSRVEAELKEIEREKWEPYITKLKILGILFLILIILGIIAAIIN